MRTQIHRHPDSTRLFVRWVLVVLFGSLALAAGCDSLLPTEAPLDNQEPLTNMANVPMALDTLFALSTLHWNGGDEDGFVQGYEWRYTTYHQGGAENVRCQLPDSAATDTTFSGWRQVHQTEWEQTSETSRTIPFDSEAEVNLQVFEVRSIDNHDMVDSSPSRRCFFTEKTVLPEVYLTAPNEGSTHFTRSQTTDWWQGVRLEAYAVDPDTNAGGGIVEMGWAVGDGDWHWTDDFERAGDTAWFEVQVPPSELGRINGTQTVKVNARDNTNLIGEPATATVELIEYTPEHNILIVDETRVGDLYKPMCSTATDATSCGGFTEESVDAFYSDIFGVSSDHVWDYWAEGGQAPPKELLRQYRTVVWHGDNPYSVAGDYHRLSDHTNLLRDYMHVGGDLVISGWRILASFRPGAPWDQVQTFEPGTFVRDYLNVARVAESPRSVFSPGDFGAATGVGSFTTVRIDSSKTAWPHQGGLGQVNAVLDSGGERAPFTKTIYSYSSRGLLDSGGLETFNGATVGHRYYGSQTGFNVVVFGFPLSFLHKEDACTLGREVLKSLGYAATGVCAGE